MNRIVLFLLFTSVALSSLAQKADTKSNYQNAFDELHQMLRGDIPVSFKRAVFVTENAYLDNKARYEDFSIEIDKLARLTKALVAADGLNYSEKDRQQVLLAASVFRVMKDTLFGVSNDNRRILIKNPYMYDMEDFWGERDWTKMFVIKLLTTQTGNCHSLPLLYKILADEFGAKAWLAVAPSHTYIKQWNDKTGWYNTELTTGQFPYDKDIKLNSYIPTEAIVDGVFMDTLSNQENIAYIITDLAKGYVKKLGYEDITTPISWLESALEYYPDYVNALILKAELQKKQYEALMFEEGISDFSKSKSDQSMKSKLAELEQSYLKIHKLGYRRMPKEMYLNWLFRVQKDTTRKPFQFATPQPFKKYDYNVQVVTAGNGENYEFFDQDTVARIGTIELNTVSGRITRFVEYDPQDIRDEVVSRSYDPAIGRWWQIDPKAEKFYNETPYNMAHNNPLKYTDPDGQAPVQVNGDCPPNCGGGQSPLRAALQSNVTSNLNAAGNSASNIVSGTIGVQAAGIGGNIKIAGLLHVEATGKAFSGEATLSGNGPEANISAVQTDFGLQVGPLGASYSQSDMTYDGENFQMRDQSGSLSAGSLQYGTSENEISIGATGGNLSGEVSMNLDAVKETINSTVEAVKGFFQNLLPTNPWKGD